MFSIIFCLTPCIKPFHLFNTLFGYNTLYLKKRKVCTLQLKLFGTSVLPELTTGSSSEQIGSTLAARALSCYGLSKKHGAGQEAQRVFQNHISQYCKKSKNRPEFTSSTNYWQPKKRQQCFWRSRVTPGTCFCLQCLHWLRLQPLIHASLNTALCVICRHYINHKWPPLLQSEREKEVISAINACCTLFVALLERKDLFIGKLIDEEAMLTGESVYFFSHNLEN